MKRSRAERNKRLRLESLEERRLLATYYVDNTGGNDANDGLSSQEAFATIQAGANQAQPGDTVVIREGIYRETVNAPRSGTSGAPIRYRAFGNEQVVISGGDVVDGWVRHNGDIWKTNVDWNADNRRENNVVFVDGELKFEAKEHAENDPLDIDDWGLLRRGRLSSGANFFLAEDIRGFGDDFWNGAKVSFQSHDWILQTKTITDYDSATGRITFTPPLDGVSQKQDNGYFIHDTFQALDQPGEWFKESGGDLLYYHAEPGQNPADLEIEFKRRGYGFNLRGRDHITLNGLTFRGVSIDTDSNSDSNVYSNNVFYGYGKGQTTGYDRFYISGQHNVFRDNEVRDTFSTIMTVQGSNNQIVNNDFHNIGFQATTRAFVLRGEQQFYSHNTLKKFARSFADGYPLRSEFAYNLFEDGGRLSWDTGVFDSDGDNGNSSYSIFHHNVFRNNDSRGIFEGFYGANNNAVIHHNVFYDWQQGGTNRSPLVAGGLNFRHVYHNTVIGNSPQGNSAGGAGVEVRYNNNLAISDSRMLGFSYDTRGNHNYTPADFVDFLGRDLRLDPGSDAIDAGIVLPGINDGYAGDAPDAGAIEFGQPMFDVGHDFTNPPNPVFDWKAHAGTNLYTNGQFNDGIGDWTINSGAPSARDRNSWNLNRQGIPLTGSFRTKSVEFKPGTSIQRTFSELKPDTTYTVGAAARVVTEVVSNATAYSGSSGTIVNGQYRSQNHVSGLTDGEWVRYDNIDFGDEGQFDEIEILYSRVGNFDSIAGTTVRLHLDAPDGPLLGEFSNPIDGYIWYRHRGDLPVLSGTHSIYVSATGGNSENIALSNIRLLHQNAPASDRLTATISSPGASTVSTKLGKSEWEQRYSTWTFKTGSSATTATISFDNQGRIDAYLDRFYLVEGDTGAGRVAPVSAAASGTALLSSSDGANIAGPTIAPALIDHSSTTTDQTQDIEGSWAQVDLGTEKPIYAIRLTAPGATPDQLSNIRVSVSANDPRDGELPRWQQDYLTDGESIAAGGTFVIRPEEIGLDGFTPLGEVNARYVRIQQIGLNGVGSHVLALAEIEVLTSDDTNLAMTDGLVTQSSTDVGRSAELAIDGSTETSSRTTDDPNSWWQVSFPRRFTAGQIELVSPNDAAVGELGDFRVSVWDSDPGSGGVKQWEKRFFSSGGVLPGDSFLIHGDEIADDGFTRLASARGSVVRVQLVGNNSAGTGHLPLSEVRVVSTENVTSASNIARQGVATQSTDHYGWWRLGVNAINGIVSPEIDFTHTTSEAQGWWLLDLQQTPTIDQIVLHNAGREGRLRASVWESDPALGGSPLWQRDLGTVDPQEKVTLQGSLTSNGERLDSLTTGRYLRIDRLNSGFLTLAEVQVWTNDAVNVDTNQLVYRYDLGPSGSPVRSDYTLVTPETHGDISWSSRPNALDRGGGSGVNNINQDLVYSSDAIAFRHKIANGVWRVTLNMGDKDAAHDQMGVLAEGRLITDSVDSAAGQFSYVGLSGGSTSPRSFDVTVTDGQLDLEFFDNGGSNPDWVLTRIVLQRETSDLVALGNEPSSGAMVDGFDSNLVINETDVYFNDSPYSQQVSLERFRFNAARNTAPLTPFVVRVDDDNRFTVLAIGDTRTNYNVGNNTFAFSDGATSRVAVGPKETLAVGFLDANSDGSNSLDSAISWNNGGDEIWYSGGSIGADSASVSVGAAPVSGAFQSTTLNRDYHFAIDINNAPELAQFARWNPGESQTSDDVLYFRAQFDLNVTDVGPDDFVVSGGSTADVLDVVPIQGTGEAMYQVLVAGGDLAEFNGTVGLDLASNPTIIDPQGNPIPAVEPSVDEVFLLDNAAPQVSELVIDDGTTQRSSLRSVTVQFDSPVVFAAGAFDLRKGDGSAVVVNANVAAGQLTNQVVLTFPGLPGDSLENGNYRLTIASDRVEDATGNPLDGDSNGYSGGDRVDDFFRFFGDTDGDRDVDGQDYGRFGLSFLKSIGNPGFNPSLDSDNDGDVDGQDYGRFGQSFLNTLDPNV